MRRVHFVVVLGVLLLGCYSQSADEKAVEEFTDEVWEGIEELAEEPSDKSLPGPLVEVSLVEVDEATARTWPEKFCSLVKDMTRDEIQVIMGTPTQIFLDQTFNVDQYKAWGYSLRIFYDIDDKARQFEANTDNVPCETKFSEK